MSSSQPSTSPLKRVGLATLAAMALVGTVSVTRPPAAAIAATPPDAAAPAAGAAGPVIAPACRERFAALAERLGSARSLIVTLPDPLDSHFAREFDLMLEAVVRGLGDQEYLPDLPCLPWPSDPAEAKTATRHRTEPGVLLFRKEGAEGAALAVLLVGETPLVGVHPAAMAEALAMVRAGGPFAAAPPGEETIEILGPTFSGSATSINEALVRLGKTLAGGASGSAEPPPDRIAVRVVSPSASDHHLGDRLRRGLDQPPIAGAVALEQVESMVVSDQELTACLWNHFVPRRLGLPTRYYAGAAMLEERLGADHPCVRDPGHPPAVSEQANGRVALLVERSAYGRLFAESGFKVIEFPMHVWRLRELYEKRRPSAQQGAAGAPAEGPDLTLERRPRGVPTFGGDGTLASQDMILAGLVDDLARRRYEVVGVVASDVLDRRFLIERLQELAPGTRIVTLEGDVLLARRSKGAAPAGALVASSYPVSRPDSEDGGRKAAGPQGCALPLDAAHGAYYGVRELISGRPVAPPRAVWLSAVGGGDLHVLAQVALAPAELAEPPPPEAATADGDSLSAALLASMGIETTRRMRLPRGWALLVGLPTILLLAAMVHVARRLWPQRAAADGAAAARAPRLLFGLIPVELIWSPKWDTCRKLPSSADRALHALVVLLPVFVGVPYLILSLPALTGAVPNLALGDSFSSDLLAQWFATMPVLVVLLLALATLYLLLGLTIRTTYDLHDTWPQRAGGKRIPSWLWEAFGIVLPLVFTVALVGAAVAIGRAWTAAAATDDPGLFSERSLALGSGVSPLLPWVIFGGVLMGWTVLSLYRHRVRQAIPTLEELRQLGHENLDDSVRGEVCRLRQAIDPAFLWQGGGVLWTLLVAAPLLYLVLYYEGVLRLPLRSIEGRAYDFVTSIFFVLAIVVAVGAGISLYRGWSALRRLLEWLRSEDGVAGGEHGWLEPVRTAYTQTGDSRLLAETRRKKALGALRAAIAALPDDPRARGLDERLALCGSPDELPAGRWLAVVSWRRGATAGDGEDAFRRLIEAADDFFLWSMVRFVRDAFVQLLQLMGFMTAALVGISIAVSIYPFEPRRVLLLYVSTLTAIGVTLSVAVIMQAREKKLLLAVEGGHGTAWTVAGRLGVYAGLPLVSMVAGRFPELRRILVDWVAPLFKTFQ